MIGSNGRSLGVIALASLLASCGSTRIDEATKDDYVKYAWVAMGDGGKPVARAATTYGTCPVITVDGADTRMTLRAATAAKLQPDLVMHIGDYHYRENACPSDIAGCKDSPWGYGWDTWEADLFKPAAPLLAAAPWIVVRGNHEECARAGQGWFRLLDTQAYSAKRTCDDPANDAVVAFLRTLTDAPFEDAARRKDRQMSGTGLVPATGAYALPSKR